MDIAKQLLNFIDRFKIEGEAQPKTTAVAKERTKHHDEIRLERLVGETEIKIHQFETLVKRRGEEEERRAEEQQREAKRKKAEEMTRQAEEKKRDAVLIPK